MAQKVTVTLEDDLVGGSAVETLRFGLEGAEYEIDLNRKNAAAFRSQLKPFVEHGRKASRGLARRGSRTAAARRRSGEIRSWAKASGIELSDRGRIPGSVIEQFRAASKAR